MTSLASLAIRVLFGGLSWLKAALRWVFSSADHLMIAGVGIVITIAYCEWHVIDKQRATIARMTAEAKSWRAAQDTDAATIRDLQTEIARQNLATMALGKDGAARVAAGAKSDDAALERSAGRTKMTDAIAMPALRVPVAGCQTDAAVLAAKGEL